jgi:integrase/recombinase XerD
MPESLEIDDDVLFLRVTGKGAKTRRVPVVDESLAKALRKYAKALPVGLRLFDLSDRRLRSIAAWVGEKAGLGYPLHPHTLRHTMATLALNKGANLETVRRVLGHESLATTQKYLALADKDVADDLRKSKW